MFWSIFCPLVANYQGRQAQTFAKQVLVDCERENNISYTKAVPS